MLLLMVTLLLVMVAAVVLVMGSVVLVGVAVTVDGLWFLPVLCCRVDLVVLVVPSISSLSLLAFSPPRAPSPRFPSQSLLCD